MEKSCKENVSLSARAFGVERRFIFQHGDDPKHWAKATVVWLKIPDFSPIEHLCNDSKTAVHKLSSSNMMAAKQFCQEEWAEIPMPRRAALDRDSPKEAAKSL